jgi:hypothetical protein
MLSTQMVSGTLQPLSPMLVQVLLRLAMEPMDYGMPLRILAQSIVGQKHSQQITTRSRIPVMMEQSHIHEFLSRAMNLWGALGRMET